MTEQEVKRKYNREWYKLNSEHRKKYMREYRAAQKEEKDRLLKIEQFLQSQGVDIDAVIQ